MILINQFSASLVLVKLVLQKGPLWGVPLSEHQAVDLIRLQRVLLAQMKKVLEKEQA